RAALTPVSCPTLFRSEAGRVRRGTGTPGRGRAAARGRARPLATVRRGAGRAAAGGPAPAGGGPAGSGRRGGAPAGPAGRRGAAGDRKSTRLNSSHVKT